MDYAESMLDLVIDNLKKLYFPEEWISLDLKFSKFELFALLFLDREKEATMSELVEYINCPMSTATGIVDRLVRKGFVERQRSDTDRRVVVVALTEEGARFAAGIKDMVFGYLNMLMEELTEEEKQFLLGIAIKVMNSLQEKFNAEAGQPQKNEEIKKIDIE